MDYEGPRRFGRFIKNGSKVLDKVSLVEFSFKEISDAKVVTPDNTRRTVIHTSYHEAKELDEGVRMPPQFNDDLMAKEESGRVLFPIDFTKEWERDKRLRKHRVSHQDDEDFELEIEAQRLRETRESSSKARPTRDASESQDDNDATSAALATDASSAANPAKPENIAQKLGDSQWDPMTVVGQAIKGFMGNSNDGEAAAPARPTDEFIPNQPQQQTQTQTSGGASDPEAQAAEEYRARVERLKAEELQLQEMIEEAKAKGYRDGFKMGEEKAEIQARQHATQLFGKVTELIGEFAGLKHEILNNVQENFYELCQAMAESLIKREFSIQPEAFVTVLRRAIAEAVEPGKFKIRVHPETFDRIAGLGQSDILEALVRDQDISAGDFKIESQLSVVDVNVSKLIKDLLEQADLTLFKEDKAG